MATDAQTVTVIKNELTWLQQHERLIIVFMVLLVGGWLGNKYLDNAAADAKTKYGIALQASNEAKAAADAAAKQYQATIDALTAQNQSLAATIATRQTVTEKRVQVVTAPNMSAADAVTGIDTAFDRKIDINIEPSGRLSFPVPEVQQFTATKIERDADEATIADQKVIIKNDEGEVNSCNTLVTSLKQQTVASDAACKAEVASVKASANKSKRTWFLIGFASGLATRLLGHF